MKKFLIPITLAAIAVMSSCSDYDYNDDRRYNYDDYETPNRQPYTQDTTIQDSTSKDSIASDTIVADSVFNPVTISGEIGGYNYVDLGISVKWATYNVGASTPEEYGNYYAWGETETKASFTYKNYKYYNDSTYQYTKYTFNTANQTTADYLAVLDSIDDAATVTMGSDWRMPTKEEIKELVRNCKWQWTNSFYGTNIAGYIGKSRINGNTIFLPATGFYNNNGAKNLGEEIAYWTASDCEDTEKATSLYGNKNNDQPTTSSDSRLYGMVIRAVSDK